jgi:hypothetical protein
MDTLKEALDRIPSPESLLDGTGCTWFQPVPAVDEWLFADAPIWSSMVGPLPRKQVEAEWGFVAEVIES